MLRTIRLDTFMDPQLGAVRGRRQVWSLLKL
jgi:hypothetical protein